MVTKTIAIPIIAELVELLQQPENGFRMMVRNHNHRQLRPGRFSQDALKLRTRNSCALKTFSSPGLTSSMGE